ncbi:MAG: AtpZ/AtpI family protein [Nocardioides sp.]
MDQQKPRDEEQSRGDPWHAFGYLVAGVGVYGLIGWALDQWLDTTFLVVIGILFGAGLGIFMTWARFNRSEPPQDETL